MTNKITISFPRGCGGNWLSNMIYHLEVNNTTHPDVNIVFDGEKESDSIQLFHGLKLVNGSFVYHEFKELDYYRYSTDALFNMYINDAYKVRYRLLGLGSKSIAEQFFTLSDSFRYVFTDKMWSDWFCHDIDLDYRLVFQDPEQFIDNVFALLTDNNVKFTPNRDYARASIAHYRSTCVDPNTVIGNLDNLVWLSAVHAVTMLKEIPLSVTIANDVTVEDLKEILAPYSKDAEEYVLPKMFKWL